MKNKTKHIIKTIEPGSIAEELELEPGDELLRVNGEIIEDVFDYHFQTNDTYLELTIRKKDGEEWDLEIEKEYDEEIGITFENEFMDQYRSCSNNCIFCFIDQMPPGMRETLYFKDDDSRLSFLQGNYITLTNMSDKDVERIVRYRLEPINISFQTTNPELRCKMLHNRFAGEALKKVDILYQGGIEMNGQIVLCRGVNDGEELERSIRDLTQYLPLLRSVSVVPVGLSKYRDGLYPLEPFTKEEAKEVIRTIEKWQKKVYAEYGIHFIHAGDEWYLLAEEEVPEEERYDGYLQLENGVGMLRLLFNEFEEGYAKLESGKHQEEESAPLVAEFFKDVPAGELDVERITWLVTHHHTYTNVEGMDYQILLEADFLVNAGESEYSKQAIENFCRKVFRTEAGTHLLKSMFLEKE